VFTPISTIFDKDGSKYGFILHCRACDWYNFTRFYSKSEIDVLLNNNRQLKLEGDEEVK
jgi:hypothetical protein